LISQHATNGQCEKTSYDDFYLEVLPDAAKLTASDAWFPPSNVDLHVLGDTGFNALPPILKWGVQVSSGQCPCTCKWLVQNAHIGCQSVSTLPVQSVKKHVSCLGATEFAGFAVHNSKIAVLIYRALLMNNMHRWLTAAKQPSAGLVLTWTFLLSFCLCVQCMHACRWLATLEQPCNRSWL